MAHSGGVWVDRDKPESECYFKFEEVVNSNSPAGLLDIMAWQRASSDDGDQGYDGVMPDTIVSKNEKRELYESKSVDVCDLTSAVITVGDCFWPHIVSKLNPFILTSTRLTSFLEFP